MRNAEQIKGSLDDAALPPAHWEKLVKTDEGVMMRKTYVSVLATIGIVFGLAATSYAQNLSFETEGVNLTTDWCSLPTPGAWVDGNGANPYEILRLSVDPTHFPSYNTAPDGINVLNLSSASPMSQNLQQEVDVGDVITLGFYIGNSVAQADPAGNVTATITLDGDDAYSELVVNDAPNGDFIRKSVQWAVTNAGTLGITLAGSSGAWIDAVEVEVSTAPELRGTVNITGWSSGIHHEWWTEAKAAGSGSVSNSLGEVDEPAGYFNVNSGSQTCSVTWADATVASYRGDHYPQWLQDRNGTASASLGIDLTGGEIGDRVEGSTSGGFGGRLYDGADGAGDGVVNFSVNFTLDAFAAGSDIDGSFGIYIDVYGIAWDYVTPLDDLTPISMPTVTGSSISGDNVSMSYIEKPGGGSAWFFGYSAEDIVNNGGSVNDTLTATFAFSVSGGAVESIEISTVASGEAEVPIPILPGGVVYVLW